MSVFTIPNIFVANTKIKSASMNANFAALATTLNTNLLPAVGNTNALVTTDSGGNLQSVLPLGTEGQTLVVDPTATTTGGLRFSTPTTGATASELANLGVFAFSPGNSLQIKLRQGDGIADPAPGTGSVIAALRNPSATTGGYNQRTIDAPLSMTLALDTTLGMVGSQDNNLWYYLIDSDGLGTMQLGCSTLRYDEGSLQSIVQESAPVTITIAGPAVVTQTNHGLTNNDAVTFTTTGTLPTGLVAGTKYWVLPIDANSYIVQVNPADGSGITTSGTQSGSHTMHIAGTRLVSNAMYTSVPVRLIGKSVYNLTTPGTWVNPIETSLAGALIYDELVACKYTSSTSQVVNGGGAVGLACPTMAFDTHGILNGTGDARFTCPVSGTYNIEAAYQSSTAVTPTVVGSQVYMFVVVNSTIQQYIHILTTQVSGVAYGFTGQGSLLLQANAGDIIQVQLSSTSGIPTFMFDGGASTTYIAVTRLASKPS